MASSIFFGGAKHVSPVTLSVINESAMQPKGLTVGNNLVVLGSSYGGQPNTLLAFQSPAESDAMLISGELRDAVRKCFAPSSQTNAPGKVYAMRVGTATQAALTLKDVGAANSLVLTSAQYGLGANQVKAKVESGTITGKKLTSQLGTAYYSQDNVGRAAFTMQYSGTGAGVAIITNIALTLTLNAVATVIDLTVYTTVQALVDRINTIAGMAATVGTGRGADPALAGLDSITGQDVKTGLYTVRADLQACVDWFNGVGEGFVTATRAANAGLPPVNIAFTYLAGGTDPAPVTQDWQNAFTVLQSAEVQWMTPLSGTPAVHAMADAHVVYMSEVARKRRRCLVGPPLGTTAAAVQALPAGLNSDRTAMVWPGVYDYNDQGALTLYPPYYAAAMVAAMFAGSNPGTAMTNKTLKVQGLEVAVRNPTDTDDLLTAGVMPLEQTKQGFKVVRSISTWLANNNFNRVEMSTGTATDFVRSNVEEALDVLRGEGANPRTLQRAIAITESTLRELAKPEPGGPGAIVGDDKSPAYQNITGTIQGDVVSVSFQCSPVIPTNFIPITIAIVPYSGTAAA